ncbi:hypothetical protein [Haladaptatus caseinilyticus]|uniref:hypothetical protein n=1 Tax=Haladaptatus caseinilyticus TaxID=2993314 RepID=UPI00224B6BC5|nr:hypothetical protein [Haladaptatus caseinilyticus]
MTDPSLRTETILLLTRTDPIQVTTTKRTLTGVIYDHEHVDPILTHRGPEPGSHTLLFATPSNDLYRLTYTYYEAYDHTQHQLDRYELTPNGKYAWVRTHASIETVTRPDNTHPTDEHTGHLPADLTDTQRGCDE